MTDAREAWVEGAARLAAAGIDSARLDARVLLAHVLGIDSGALLAAAEPSPDELARYRELIARRAAHEPIAYITGEREFWSLSFAVGPGVLIPRPETETLVEEATRRFPERSAKLEVLDLGTGSGCLLIAFLKTYPQARGLGIDRSEDAISWARLNAERLGVADRASWRQGDFAQAEGGRYDVVFANPPYLATGEAAALAPEIACHEPAGALFAGQDGLDAYRALGPLLAAVLKPAGVALIEIGRGQQEVVSRLLNQAGLVILAAVPDLAGIPRCLAAGPAPGKSQG